MGSISFFLNCYILLYIALYLYILLAIFISIYIHILIYYYNKMQWSNNTNYSFVRVGRSKKIGPLAFRSKRKEEADPSTIKSNINTDSNRNNRYS